MYDFIVPQELSVKDRIGAFTIPQWGFIAFGVLMTMFLLMSDGVPLAASIPGGVVLLAVCFTLAVYQRHGMPIYEYFFIYLEYRSMPKEMIYKSDNEVDLDSVEENDESEELILE